LGIVPPNSDYHRRQAATLVQLAQNTRDSNTASALMRMAAEHITLAEEAAWRGANQQTPSPSDPRDARAD
jgi:hypothetical protein